MNRRTVLRHLAVASGLALAAPIIATPRPVAGSGADRPLETIGATATAAVADLAAIVGAPAWCPADHLLRRGGFAAPAARAATGQAAARGYTETGAALVYRAAGEEAGVATLFFAITDAGGAHALAPFIYPAGEGHRATLLGGPALVGLAAGARALATDYPHLTGAAIGRAVLPAGEYGYYAPSFEVDDEWTALYPTRTGAVGMRYTPERRPYHEEGLWPMPGTGILALVLFDAAHEVREARRFRIAYMEARIW
jgi:hypothetical protein